jgi:hypothetical protein
VRVANIGGEKFEEAQRGALACGGNERRQLWTVIENANPSGKRDHLAPPFASSFLRSIRIPNMPGLSSRESHTRRAAALIAPDGFTSCIKGAIAVVA